MPRGGDKLSKAGGIIGGRVHGWHMAGAAQQAELRAGNEVCGFAHEVRGGGAVLGPGNPESWDAQPGGGGVEIGARDGGGAAGKAFGVVGAETLIPRLVVPGLNIGARKPPLAGASGELLHPAGAAGGGDALGPDFGRGDLGT